MQTQGIRSAFLHAGQPKILVIENDDPLAEIIEQFFEIAGYNYYITGWMEDISHLAEAYEPNMVILDYLLPEAISATLCMQLKKNYKTRDLPVLIYSVYPATLFSAEDCRADAFITKPFDLDNLQQVIAQLLKKNTNIGL